MSLTRRPFLGSLTAALSIVVLGRSPAVAPVAPYCSCELGSADERWVCCGYLEANY